MNYAPLEQQLIGWETIKNPGAEKKNGKSNKVAKNTYFAYVDQFALGGRRGFDQSRCGCRNRFGGFQNHFVETQTFIRFLPIDTQRKKELVFIIKFFLN